MFGGEENFVKNTQCLARQVRQLQLYLKELRIPRNANYCKKYAETFVPLYSIGYGGVLVLPWLTAGCGIAICR